MNGSMHWLYDLNLQCLGSSAAVTCASKVRPEWQRLSGLQRIKPGRISSSSMPFSLNFRFSPGPASSVSTSSLNRLKTSTVCCNTRFKITNVRGFGYINPSSYTCSFTSGQKYIGDKAEALQFSSYKSCFVALEEEHSGGNLTLFGIMTNCWALLMDPDSSFPRITVPMS